MIIKRILMVEKLLIVSQYNQFIHPFPFFFERQIKLDQNMTKAQDVLKLKAVQPVY